MVGHGSTSTDPWPIDPLPALCTIMETRELSGVIPGGDEHAEPGEIRVQQYSTASQRHQLVSNADDCILGRHADQGTSAVFSDLDAPSPSPQDFTCGRWLSVLCPVSTIPLPFFGCRFAVPVSRCRFRTLLPFPLPLPLRFSMPWLVGVDDWLASYRTTEKIELDRISTEERLRQLFAVYGCNGTEFSYVGLIFKEQRNFTTAERRNGNRRTATEWWKSGIVNVFWSFAATCKLSNQ